MKKQELSLDTENGLQRRHNMKLVFAGGHLVFYLFIGLLSFPLFTDCDKLRLVGPTRCSGRVEVYNDGDWWTVCDDSWGRYNSEVLCRELNCGPFIENKNGAFFEPGKDPLRLDSDDCRGSESDFLFCLYRPFGVNNCDHLKDVGIVCSDPVRLINGTDRCSGTLEVFHNGEWDVVCNKNWDLNKAKTVCGELNCGALKITHSTSGSYKGYTSTCPGNMTSVLQCTFTKDDDMCQAVSIVCAGVGDIKLVNGSDRCSGRVEVFFNGRWGTVCDDDWDIRDAQVVCRAMDCGTAQEVKRSAFFGKGEGEIWLDNVECYGNESSLEHCQHPSIGKHNCDHRDDAGVVCLSHLRLINGTDECSGRVEFYQDGEWPSALQSTWGMNEATVVCGEMNCGEALSFSGLASKSERQRVYDVSCTNTESSLTQCKLKEYNLKSGDNVAEATVVCSGYVRLADGPNRCAGRVEVYHKGQWGNVCGDSWDLNDAAVVCQQLKCGHSHKITTAPDYGHGTGHFWVDQAKCSGQESTFSTCSIKLINQTCDSTSVAGVICSEGLVVRLVNGQDQCSGRVEVRYGNEWGTVCDSAWSKRKAKVVCDLLECGHVVDAVGGAKYLQGSGPVFDASEACFINMTSLHQCTLNGLKTSTCGHDKDASVICGGDSTIRLVNGTDRCAGRVEILYNNLWGTVCDDEWDIQDAQVVCRAKDCGSALAAVTGGFFGQGTGKIWLDDVNCLGNESSIVKCQHRSFGESNCGHGKDAGVICAAQLRLINGTDLCSGSVELYYDGLWLPAVNVNWGINEATVACREMTCGDPVQFSESLSQTELLSGYKVSCTGRESLLTQCTVREYTRTNSDQLRHASVVCSGKVRLADGPNRCAGRVEVYNKGQWGNVCGDSWDMKDATVLCQQLNCGKSFRITTDPIYGHGTGNFWIEHIECDGRESTLHQCTHRTGSKTCNVSSVICEDSLNIRLVDGPDRCTGKVEVLNGNVWGSVCNTNWTLDKAEVVCELLECVPALNINSVAHFNPRTRTETDALDSCFSSVKNLQQCLHKGITPSTCASYNDASVHCPAEIRVVGGPNACSGRVEVMHKGEWGSVCDYKWDMDDAKVVCRQLGCGLPVSAVLMSYFGGGTGPIWMDNVACRGTESAFTLCRHDGFGKHYCDHDEDAGVVCLEASLPKPQIILKPGPEVNLGDRVEITCTIVTEHFGGTFVLSKTNGSFKMEKNSFSKAATFIFLKVNFSQNGSYYCEFKKKLPNVIFYPRGDVAALTVKVRLEKPNISMTSPYPMLITSPDKISVNQGESFKINCSVHSNYSGGFFYLSKSNINASEAKPALHQSALDVAVFEFPWIEHIHQGEYSCVYGVNSSSHSFGSAPSRAIHVTVMARVSSSVVSGVVISLLLLLLLLAVGYVVWKKRRWGTNGMVHFVNRCGGALQDIGNNGRGDSAGTTAQHSVSHGTDDDLVMDAIKDMPRTLYSDHEPLVPSH